MHTKLKYSSNLGPTFKIAKKKRMGNFQKLKLYKRLQENQNLYIYLYSAI